MNCNRVSPGWYCAGERDHEGPCAAWPPCWFCGYLGPGLRELGDFSAMCAECADHVFRVDQYRDTRSRWQRIKDALDRWFGW